MRLTQANWDRASHKSTTDLDLGDSPAWKDPKCLDEGPDSLFHLERTPKIFNLRGDPSFRSFAQIEHLAERILHLFSADYVVLTIRRTKDDSRTRGYAVMRCDLDPIELEISLALNRFPGPPCASRVAPREGASRVTKVLVKTRDSLSSHALPWLEAQFDPQITTRKKIILLHLEVIA